MKLAAIQFGSQVNADPRDNPRWDGERILTYEEVRTIKEKVLKAAGKRGKTKRELAERLGVGHSYVSRLVNELYDEGKLVVRKTKKPTTGRPAPVYSQR